MKYKAVIFDLFETLVPYKRNNIDGVLTAEKPLNIIHFLEINGKE